MDMTEKFRVLEIVSQFLDDNEYDGLFNDACDCACRVSDLAPCSDVCWDCQPGYLHNKLEKGSGFKIGLDKPAIGEAIKTT
jgi:hypothetical protein